MWAGRQCSALRCRCKWLLAILAQALLLPSAVAGEARPVTNSWSASQQAAALLRALDLRSEDSTQLLNEIQTFLVEHGASLIPSTDDSELPAHHIFAERLAASGYADGFRERFATEAASRLAALSPRDRAGLRGVAQAYPHTAAAQQAWQGLADLAWDAGRLGDFRDHARRCPEAPGIQDRLAALAHLDAPTQRPTAPQQLDQLGEMWRLAIKGDLGRRNRFGHYVQDEDPTLSVARLDAQTLVLGCGRYALLVHTLTGHRIGPLHRIGTDVLAPSLAQAACSGDRAVLLGRSGFFHTLSCFDTGGRMIWRANADRIGHQAACSNPVILDKRVVVCTVGIDNGGTSIRANGFSLRNGDLRWSSQIARIPGRPRQLELPAPLIGVHDGELVVLSQQGFIARLSSSGRLLGLHHYTRQLDGDLRRSLSLGTETETRAPFLHTVGTDLLMRAADQRHLLRLSPNPRHLDILTRDPVDGPALSADQGLLAFGGQSLHLFDPTIEGLRWSCPSPDGRTVEWADIGADSLLAATDRSLFRVDLVSGRFLAIADPWPAGHLLGQLDGILLGSDDQYLRAFGDADGLEAHLQAALARDPEDPQPHLAWAALYQARNQPLDAIAALRAALERGAPASTVDRCLDVLRPHLRLHLGDERFAALLAALTSLQDWRTEIGYERDWWLGHDFLARGDEPQARRAWARIPPRLGIAFDDGGIRLDLGFSAHLAASALTDGIDLGPRPPSPPLSIAQAGWQRELRGYGQLFLHNDCWFWHCNGFLQGIDATTGATVWQQQGQDDDHPMLGILLRNPQPGQRGVPVSVIPGSSADLAGIRTDDQVLRFNQDTVLSARDVIRAVRTLDIDSPFTAHIERDGTELTLTGQLGSWPEEACAGNQDFLVTRNLDLRSSRNDLVDISPDTDIEPTLRVYHLASGALYWRHPVAIKQGVTRPVLSTGNILLLADNNSLQAWDLNQATPLLRWELPGQGYELTTSTLLAEHLLLVLDESHQRLRLRRIDDGSLVFSSPWHPSYPPRLSGSACFLTDPDLILQRIDLLAGKRSWRLTEHPGQRIVALADHFVYTVDQYQHLHSWLRHNGQPHRSFGRWQRLIAQADTADRLYFYATDDTGREHLGAIATATGTLAWSLPLATHIELLDNLHASPQGVSLLVGDDQQRRVVLACTAEGSLRGALRLQESDSLLEAGGALFARNPTGLRHLDFTSPTIPQLLCPSATLADESWTDSLRTVAPEAWQERPWGRFACVRDQQRLALLIETDQADTSLSLRLDRSQGPLIAQQQELAIPAQDDAQILHADAPWVLLDEQRPTDGPRLILVQLLDDGTPSLRWHLHLDQPNSDTIWWLRRNWRRLGF